MATQDDCRIAILREWAKRKPDKRYSTYGERWEFFAWLKQNRMDLLDFRTSAGADQWTVVDGWLRVSER